MIGASSRPLSVRQMTDLTALANFDIEMLNRVLLSPLPDGDWCGIDPFGSLMIWDYDMAVAALEHPDLWAPTVEETSLGMITDGPALEWSRLISSFTDGPVQRHQRAAMAPAFMRTAIEPLRPMVAEVAAGLVGRLGPEPELVTELAWQYPQEVFAQVLGADPGQLAELTDDVAVLTRLWGYTSGEVKTEIDAAVVKLDSLASELRACPFGMVERIEQIDLDEAQRQALVMQLVVSGWETTAAQTANLLWLLAADAGRWSSLTDGTPAVAVALEAIRMEPSATATVRLAHVDTVLGDVAIPAGTRVIPSFVWASRDPSVYVRPDDWLPRRWTTAEPPRGPIAFGSGRHRCLGERLALMELEEMVLALGQVGPTGGWDVVGETEWSGIGRPHRPLTLRVRERQGRS